MSQLSKRVDVFVGERIRDRRTNLGLTQEKLAGSLQISYQQVQKYETGANRISAGRLFELARLLNVNVGYFFEGLDENMPAQPMEHGGKNRSTIELVRNFSTIKDANVRAAVSGLVKSISNPRADDA